VSIGIGIGLGVGVLSSMGATESAYLLRDTFASGSVAAGTRNADVGSETITDGSTNLSINTTQARLIVADGTTTWGDPRVEWSGDYATFGALGALIRLTGAAVTGPAIYLHSASNPTPTSAGIGASFVTPQLALVGGSATYFLSNGATRIRSIDYLFVIVKRAGGGAIVGVSGGVYGVFPLITPLWIVDTDSITTAYAGLTNNDGAWRAKSLSIVKSSVLPAALTTRYGATAAADTFTRANGNLVGSSTEVGGLTWAAPSGTPTIASNVVATGTGEVRAYVTLAALPRIVEVTVNAGASGNIWAAVFTRFDSTNQNFIMLRVEKTAWRLEQRTGASGGTSTILAQGAYTAVNGGTYRLRILDDGANLRAYINDHEVNASTSIATTFNNDKFGVGFTRASSADGSSTFDNFAAWPATITVPSELGPFTTVPVGTGAATITDAFTAADGTALSTYNAAWSTFGSGSWQINSNKARISAAATSGYAVRETSLTDHEAAVTIALPANPVSGDWFCGPIVRCVDSSNYVMARYLYQSNSPEVEITETVAGVSSIIGFVNLGAGNLAGSSTHTLKLAIKGQEVAAYHDGELVCQAYATGATGTKAGMGIDATASGQPTFDDFTVKAT
jgi:hypothetical protein